MAKHIIIEREDNKVVIDGEGDPCPRCKQPMQIREWKDKEYRQLHHRVYYSRWFYCVNPDCETTTVTPKRFEVRRGRGTRPEVKVEPWTWENLI